jgi:hypothetical protein
VDDAHERVGWHRKIRGGERPEPVGAELVTALRDLDNTGTKVGMSGSNARLSLKRLLTVGLCSYETCNTDPIFAPLQDPVPADLTGSGRWLDPC